MDLSSFEERFSEANTNDLQDLLKFSELLQAQSIWHKASWLQEFSLAHSHIWLLSQKNQTDAVIDAVIQAVLVFWRIEDSIEILWIAVHPAYRRQYFAQKLIQKLLIHAKNSQVQRIFLEVRKSNASAQLLYRSLGFDKITSRADYYNDPTEDADVLQKIVNG